MSHSTVRLGNRDAPVQAYDDNGTNILATQLTLNQQWVRLKQWNDRADGDYNTPLWPWPWVATEPPSQVGFAIDEIFDEVDVASGVVYGENITVIPACGDASDPKTC